MKDEVSKSSAWTKEGKREREMSQLILPKPERVTMKAAIFPRSERKSAVKSHVKEARTATVDGDGNGLVVQDADNSASTDESAEIASTALVEFSNNATSREATSTINNAITEQSSNQSAAPQSQCNVPASVLESTKFVPPVPAATQDAAQVLIQLIALLRADDKALDALKSIVTGMSLAAVNSGTVVTEEPTHVAVGTSVKTPVEMVQTVFKTSVAASVGPIIPTPAVSPIEISPEISVSLSTDDLGVPADATSSTVDTATVTEKLDDSAIIIRSRKTKTAKDKSKSKENSHKSKSKNRSKHEEDRSNRTTDVTIGFAPQIEPAAQSSSVEQFVKEPSAIVEPTVTVTPKKDVIENTPVDEELTREDLWYRVADVNNDDLEISAKAKLQDLKELPPHHSTRHTKEKNRKRIAKTDESTATPIKSVTIGCHAGGSSEAYLRSFKLIDAVDDLGITSKPKGAVLSKLEPAPTAEKIVPSKSIKAVDKPIKSVPSSSVHEISTKAVEPMSPVTPTTSNAPAKSVDKHTSITSIPYDFSPPSPRRVKRREILTGSTSKEVGTQTSPPTQLAELPTIQIHHVETTSRTDRPAAVHHAHYYNTVPRIATRTSHPSSRKDAIGEVVSDWRMHDKGGRGSDDTWMSTMKNVDAADDLMIMSKPREDADKEDVMVDKVERTVETQINSPTDVETAIDSEGLSDPSILASIESTLAMAVPTMDILATSDKSRKDKKKKSDKDDKKSKKDKKEKKSKNSSKRHKSKTTIVESAAMESTAPTSASAVRALSDIFGDLLGDEIPKWDILAPTA
jgi:hypothetical protein